MKFQVDKVTIWWRGMASWWNCKLTQVQCEMAHWHRGKLVKRQVGEMASWWNGKLLKMAGCWDAAMVDEMASWWNGKLTKWQVDEMASWWNGKFMKWQVDEMASSWK